VSASTEELGMVADMFERAMLETVPSSGPKQQRRGRPRKKSREGEEDYPKAELSACPTLEESVILTNHSELVGTTDKGGRRREGRASKVAATNNRNLIDANLTTGENISQNYILSTWEYPFATNLSLFFSTFPSNLIFFLNTHLHPMGLHPSGNGTKSHISLFLSATIFLIHGQSLRLLIIPSQFPLS
jgi:hypothetical protein